MTHGQLGEQRARETGLDLLGFYHSHPHSVPVPSPTDLAESTYPDALQIIVGLSGEARGDEMEARAYYLRVTHYVEVPLTPAGSPGGDGQRGGAG